MQLDPGSQRRYQARLDLLGTYRIENFGLKTSPAPSHRLSKSPVSNQLHIVLASRNPPEFITAARHRCRHRCRLSGFLVPFDGLGVYESSLLDAIGLLIQHPCRLKEFPVPVK